MRPQKAAAAAAAGPEMVCPSCGYGAPPAAGEEPAEAVSDGNDSEPEEVRPRLPLRVPAWLLQELLTQQC